VSRFGTSYDASPSVVLSSRAWLSSRSCTPSSKARPTGTSCANSGVAHQSTPTSYSTSPPALVPVRRLWRPSSTPRKASMWTMRPAEGSKSKEPQQKHK
jgi:hypothetical protein